MEVINEHAFYPPRVIVKLLKRKLSLVALISSSVIMLFTAFFAPNAHAAVTTFRNQRPFRIAILNSFVATLFIMLQVVWPQGPALAATNKSSTQSVHPNICPTIVRTSQGKFLASSSKKASPLTCSQGSAVLIDSFSHYMKESSIGALDSDATSMGSTDAAKENSQITCTSNNVANVTAVLDFGQPIGNTTVYDWGGLTMQYSDAENALYDYINAWLNKPAKSCLSLTAVLGVNNSYICGSIGEVDPCDANNGAALEQAAASVNATFAFQGILVVGGSDIEIDPTYWSNYTATQKWLAGYFGAGTDFMYDYGDTCSDYSCSNSSNGWTVQDVYNVAWGIGYDEPLPEIYTSDWATMWAWTDTQTGSQMGFEGVANEQWGQWYHHIGWATALNTFRSDLPSGTALFVSSTCFPSIDTNWSSDDCYNVNNQ